MSAPTPHRRGGAGQREFRVHREDRPRDSVELDVARAVAAIEDTPPDRLEPLSKSVDPEAIDAFLRWTSGESPATDREVAFEYAEYRVTIHSDGVIHIRSLEGSDPAE